MRYESKNASADILGAKSLKATRRSVYGSDFPTTLVTLTLELSPEEVQ